MISLYNIPFTIGIVKGKNGKKFGAFTNIDWGQDDKAHKKFGNTFLFKIDNNPIFSSLTIFPYKKDQNEFEVFHSSKNLFEIYKGFHITEGLENAMVTSNIPS